jgi:perosamine synthetase
MKSDLGKYTFYRGRVGLYAILTGLGIGEGDDVAIQSFTCLAVPEAILAVNARPVYVDIEAAGFNMAQSDLINKITSKTKAIIVQHTFGIPAKIDAILEVSKKNNIPIIEDCCHSIMSTYNGLTVGNFGIASFYSFEWGKPIVIGIGGSVIINNDTLESKVAELYHHYKTPRAIDVARIQLQYYIFKLLYRPSLYRPIRALFHWLGALGVVKGNYNPVGKGEVARDFTRRMPTPLKNRLEREAKRLEAMAAHSQSVTLQYRSQIRSLAVSHAVLPETDNIVLVRYPLLARNKSQLIEQARRANIELSGWYATPVHPLSVKDSHLAGYEAGSCLNAEQRCREVVTLPIRSVSERDIRHAIEFFNHVV